MQCVNCGLDNLHEKQIEKYEYIECGLRGVYLQGISVHVCDNCSEQEVAIPAIEKLHQVIAVTLSQKTQRLQPDEVKFLRKYLGLSGKDFANLLRVTPETVSRWENPKRDSEYIGEVSELLLRTLVIGHVKPIDNYSEIQEWGKTARASFKAVFQHVSNSWEGVKAA